MTANALHPLNLHAAHPSWRACLAAGLKQVDPAYLAALTKTTAWLPGPNQIFNAFSIPIKNVRFVLIGESPYPRQQSANGYAFWDAAVKTLWSPTGLSKQVNRATSLRNMIKMLLIANHFLDEKTVTQATIANLDKSTLVQTNDEFFHNFLARGFLLLNASLVLQAHQPPIKDARALSPLLKHVINHLLNEQPNITFLLLGGIAKEAHAFLPPNHTHKLIAEHPYNLSFIQNKSIHAFFEPLHLLEKSYKK